MHVDSRKLISSVDFVIFNFWMAKIGFLVVSEQGFFCFVVVVVGSNPVPNPGPPPCCCGVQSGKLFRDLLVIAFLLLWGPIRKNSPGSPCCRVVVVGSNPENYSGTSLLLRWYVAFLLLLGDSNSERPRCN